MQIKDNFGQEYCLEGETCDSLPALLEAPESGNNSKPWMKTFCEPAISLLHQVLKAIWNLLPFNVQPYVDELGLFMIILFLICLLINLFLRLLDSTKGKKQRMKLHHYVTLANAKKALEVENDKLQKQMGSLKSDRAAAQEALQKLKNINEPAENDINKLQDEVDHLEGKTTTLEKELKNATNELAASKAKLINAETECSKLSSELDECKLEKKQLESQCKEYRDTCDRSNDKAIRLEGEIETLKRELKTSKPFEDRCGALKKDLDKVQMENSELSSRNGLLESQVDGLQIIVECLPTISSQFDDGGEKDADNWGWSDVGDWEERKEKLAQLTNAAYLNGQLKQAKAELEKMKAALQSETDIRVKLESDLTFKKDFSEIKQKLERTEEERRDLLGQIKQLTNMMNSKDEESLAKVEELRKELEKLRVQSEMLQSDAEHQKYEKNNWEEKYKDREQRFLQIRRDLEKKETQFFHDLTEKETKIQQLQMEILKLRQQSLLNTSAQGEAGPGGVASNNSFEAEIVGFTGESPPLPLFGAAQDNWGFLPSCPPPGMYSGWSDTYDSPPSSGEFPGRLSSGRSRQSQGKGRAGTDAESKRERSGKERKSNRSRGAAKSQEPEDTQVKEASRWRYSPSMCPPYPSEFDYGSAPSSNPLPPSRRDYFSTASYAGPHQMPLLSGDHPTDVKEKLAATKQRPKSSVGSVKKERHPKI